MYVITVSHKHLLIIWRTLLFVPSDILSWLYVYNAKHSSYTDQPERHSDTHNKISPIWNSIALKYRACGVRVARERNKVKNLSTRAFNPADGANDEIRDRDARLWILLVLARHTGVLARLILFDNVRTSKGSSFNSSLPANYCLIMCVAVTELSMKKRRV